MIPEFYMRIFSNDPVEPGIFAVGQFVTGIFVIGQFSRGIFVIGQFAVGVFAIGQFAVGLLWAYGQFAVAARASSFMGALSLVPKLRWPWEEANLPSSLPLLEIAQEKRLGTWGRAKLTRTAEFESVGKKIQVQYTRPELAEAVTKAANKGVSEGLLFVQAPQEQTVEEARGYRETPKTETVLLVDQFVPIKDAWRGLFLHPDQDSQPIGSVNALFRLVLYAPLVYALWHFVIAPAAALS
jgi:hypothetical protein